MREVLDKVGLLIILKPKPDMPDNEATVEAITEECVLHGSPSTVLDKLIAFRDTVGPFGGLLQTGLDWGGKNQEWEREIDAAPRPGGDAEIPPALSTRRPGGGIGGGVDAMRLGLFMMPVHPPGRTLSDTLREDTAKSLLADQLGFDELWMGEHFSATTEPFPSPLMFLAGLVPQTKNLTLRHRRHQPAQPPPGHRRRRGRAVRPHVRRALHARHRAGRARVRP